MVTNVSSGGKIGATGIADYMVEVPGHGREVFGHGEIHKTPAAKGAQTGYEYHKKKATEASAKAVDSDGHTAAASAHMEAIVQAGHGTKESAFHEEAYNHHMKMAAALPASQPAAKETKPNANTVHEHYPWGRLTKVEGKKQALLDGVHKVGMDLLDNDALAEHHENIKNKLRGLKANPTVKHAAQVAGDLKLIAEKANIEYGHQRGDAPAKTKSKYQHDDWSW